MQNYMSRFSDRLAQMSRCGESMRPIHGPAVGPDHKAAQGRAGLARGLLRLLELAARLHLP